MAVDFSHYDHLLGPLFVCDSKHSIIYYNNFCSIFFKLPPRKLQKVQAMSQLFSTEDLNLEDMLLKVFKENAIQIGPEIDIKTVEASLHYTVQLKMIPLDSKHCLVQLVDFSIEKKLFEKYKDQIKELKEGHQQILMSDKLRALGELTATLGHEISNPLTVMYSRLDQLGQYAVKKNDQKIQEYLQDLNNCYHRIKKNISNIQNFVKDQESPMDICSLNSIISHVKNIVGDIEGMSSIEFSVKMDVEPAWVMGDNLKLEQIIINLIKNAKDALKSSKIASPKIDLVLESSPQGHVLSIIDNGPGVDEAIREKIFDMFYTTKEMGEGTGLGLAISQKFAESFMGSLFLDQQDGTTGAVFKLVLPSIETLTFTQTNKYLMGERDIEDKKIVLFSHDVHLCDAIFQALSHCPYVIIVTTNLATLEEVIDFYLVDCVANLSDIEIKSEEAHVINFSKKERDSKKVIESLKKFFVSCNEEV